MTMRAPDDYGSSGYGIYVDGKRVLGRDKEDGITAEDVTADVEMIVRALRRKPAV